MLRHDFGIIDNLSDELYIYENYEPAKYHCISIHDDYILPLLIEFETIDTFFHNTSRPEKGLAYYGITLIPFDSLINFKQILNSKDNFVYQELIEVIDKAISEKKYMIHYGI